MGLRIRPILRPIPRRLCGSVGVLRQPGGASRNASDFRVLARESFPVLKLSTFSSGTLALAYWLGLAGARLRGNGCGRILMLHGIARRHARLFERVVRYVRRHFQVVPLLELIHPDAKDLSGKLAITFDD